MGRLHSLKRAAKEGGSKDKHDEMFAVIVMSIIFAFYGIMLIDNTAGDEKSHLKKMRIGLQKHQDTLARVWSKGEC